MVRGYSPRKKYLKVEGSLWRGSLCKAAPASYPSTSHQHRLWLHRAPGHTTPGTASPLTNWLSAPNQVLAVGWRNTQLRSGEEVTGAWWWETEWEPVMMGNGAEPMHRNSRNGSRNPGTGSQYHSVWPGHPSLMPAGEGLCLVERDLRGQKPFWPKPPAAYGITIQGAFGGHYGSYAWITWQRTPERVSSFCEETKCYNVNVTGKIKLKQSKVWLYIPQASKYSSDPMVLWFL